MKRILLPGLFAAAAALAAAMVTGYLMDLLFPSLTVEYSNTTLYRPWSDPAMSAIFVAPVILGIVLSFLWDRVSGLLGETLWIRGSRFGLGYWLLSLSGMIITYSTFPVSILMALSWTFSTLLQGVCVGFVLAATKK